MPTIFRLDIHVYVSSTSITDILLLTKTHFLAQVIGMIQIHLGLPHDHTPDCHPLHWAKGSHDHLTSLLRSAQLSSVPTVRGLNATNAQRPYLTGFQQGNLSLPPTLSPTPDQQQLYQSPAISVNTPSFPDNKH